MDLRVPIEVEIKIEIERDLIYSKVPQPPVQYNPQHASIAELMPTLVTRGDHSSTSPLISGHLISGHLISGHLISGLLYDCAWNKSSTQH
jgi:hypothetical protein